MSVIMNCYNSERFLKEALDSIYAQTYPAWEVIFWDNGSTDGSAAIAQRYDARVRYHLAPGTTPLGAARALAVARARGEFLAFLDCDDVFLPGTLERLVSVIGDRYALCYAAVLKINERGEEIGQLVPTPRAGDLFGPLLEQYDIFLAATLVRRAALTETGLSFDPAIVASEDYCLFLQLAAAFPFVATDEVLGKYRIHDNALTNKTIDKWADEREYTLQRILDAHPGIRDRYPRAFDEAYARARYYRARWLLERGEKRKAIAELARTVFVSARYAGLFLLSLLPMPVWNEVHQVRTHRSRFG